MRWMIPALCVVAAAAVTACGDDESSTTTQGNTSSTTTSGGGGMGGSGDGGMGGAGDGGMGGMGQGGEGGSGPCTADMVPAFGMDCSADPTICGCGECHTFMGQGNTFCTVSCTSIADCPPPATACNNMGICRF